MIELYDEGERLQDWMEARGIDVTRAVADINDPFDAEMVKEDLEQEIHRSKDSSPAGGHAGVAPHSMYA
jgi:hypothetical protein